MFAGLSLILASLLYDSQAETISFLSNTSNVTNVTNITSHCIPELEAILPTIQLNLSYPHSKIEPNYSVATSVSYHNTSSTILIAGDFFYINPKDSSSRTYYSYFQAFSHTNSQFKLKYNGYSPYINPTFGNKFITHKSLRSWTRIIAHPTLPYFYVLGIENLTQYNVINGQFMWTANIASCSKQSNHNQPLIYTDVTFFKSDANNLYVAGNCVGPSGKTVIVLDEYSIHNGEYNNNFRMLYNLTQLGFFKEFKYLDDFGESPPQITIEAPVNESLITSIVDKYFYIGFTHLLFTGIARIEHDTVSNNWRVKKWPSHWTLVNPSFITHHSLVTTMKENGLISLLDPSINGLISLFIGKMKHLSRWDTQIRLGQLDEKNIYNKFTWYGGHIKYDLHLAWTLSIDVNNYKHIYVTTSPLIEHGNKNFSTVAKHNIKGDIIGGAKVPFYALDSIVTNDNQIITVGFEWISNPFNNNNNNNININIPNISNILPYFERRAVFSVFNNEIVNSSSCIGCETDYYDGRIEGRCGKKCLCENGYCNDTRYGNGKCYCTLMSYGEFCRACDGIGGSCDPLKGLCNSGPNGDGKCKFCYDVEIDIGDNITNSSFDFGIGSKYGPECNLNCTCNNKNGICYTTGDISKSNAGECIYCTDNIFYGTNCDMKCKCNSKTEYCSNGVSGTGCVKYDYGGLLKDKGWGFYTIIASALFVLFFSITWWQTMKHFKEENNGKSIPWCPQKEIDEPIFDNNNNNDPLKENMIKKRNVQNDPNGNQPPAVSTYVDGNDKNKDKYNI